MQPLITSRTTQIVLGILVTLILMSLSFLAGAKSSERRMRHLSNWSAHYPERMQPHRGMRMMEFRPQRPLPLPNGVFGRILSATGTNLMVEGQDHFEQNVLITTSTAIRTEQGTASMGDVQPNMEVGVFGQPNEQGQIEARLIRLFPNR